MADTTAIVKTGLIIGPTLGALFIVFILVAFIYLWHHARRSEAEIERTKTEDLERGSTDEGPPKFEAVPSQGVSGNGLPPPYTRFAAPQIPEPAVVRVTN
ncbi:hypothetical protein H072_10046 [Dactylellina haptotyla CBS 200.50]|uniref:Uncharacterized protein n=1 Tax=Dactylellina haptotyla (strain CBS 200.50) TaxID=1284197 RepID=S8A1A1_DACHA|nr:hypothetical protein H072_10046 [Dactylellina haptotyla CBS 200.50]